MSLKVVIIGSNGFIGHRLSRTIVSMSHMNISPTESLPLMKIILFDKKTPSKKMKDDILLSSKKAKDLNPNRISFVTGDICNKAQITNIFNPHGFTRVTVIHLAAILSGYSETDFDLGMKVNFYGTMNILECLRAVSHILHSPQILFYSSTNSTLAFNEYNKSNPSNEQSFRLSSVSYGCQKACMEIMISDYTRKGFIDGRVGRFGAVLGKPQFVDVLSFAWHGIFTQTLQGKDYNCCLPFHAGIPCCSLSNVVQNIIHLSSTIDSHDIGHNRVVCFPAETFTLEEIWNETQNIAGEYHLLEKLGKLIEVSAEENQSTVKQINICPRLNYNKAEILKCDTNVTLREIITDFIQEHILPKKEIKNAAVMKSKL